MRRCIAGEKTNLKSLKKSLDKMRENEFHVHTVDLKCQYIISIKTVAVNKLIVDSRLMDKMGNSPKNYCSGLLFLTWESVVIQKIC